MLEITKFKLIDGGRSGITIEAREGVQLSGNYQVIDKVSRERKLILPDTIIAKIQQLKYYFFNCTGHWMAPFNAYYDLNAHEVLPMVADENGKVKSGHEILHKLWQRTEITGVSFKSGGFVITGKIESVEGKKTVINTPFITEEDDLGFFSSAVEKIEECVKDIVMHFSTHALPSYRPETILSEEEMKGLNMKELTDIVVNKLVDRNMIMLIKDEGGEEEPMDTITHSSKTIDSDNIPNGSIEDIEPDVEPDIEPDPEFVEDIPQVDPEVARKMEEADAAIRAKLSENEKPVFGAPASDTEMPDEFKSKDKVAPKDLESLEHSENMGLGGEERPATETDDEQWGG